MTRSLPKPTPVLIHKALIGLGERLGAARKARGLTQAELAQLADVGVSTVASIEGGHDGVAIGNVFKVLEALRLLGQVEQLLAPERDPELVNFALRTLKSRNTAKGR